MTTTLTTAKTADPHVSMLIYLHQEPQNGYGAVKIGGGELKPCRRAHLTVIA